MRPSPRRPAFRSLLLLLLLSGCAFGGDSTPTTVRTGSPSPATAPRGSATASGTAAATGSPVTTVANTVAIPTASTTPAPSATPASTVRPVVPTPTPQPVPKPNPKGDQTLTMPGPQTLPDTLDPALIRDNSTTLLVRQVWRGLVRLDDALNVVPDIAADYAKSADGRTMTFYLRSSARFQDGRQITAEDVAFSLRRACDPATARGVTPQNLPAASGLNDIVGCTDRLNGRTADVAGIAVLDPLTLTITLDAPKAYFLQKLTLVVASVIDRNDLARGAGWSTAKPNGSGPFRLAGWAGDAITLTRWEGFYDQVATLEKVTLLVGARAANAANLYDDNKVDIASVGYTAVDRLNAATASTRGQLRVTPQLSTFYIGINTKLAPLDAFNIRAALVRVIDRQKIQAAAYDGKVAPAKGIIPPAIPGGDWTANFPILDAKTAKELLPPDKAKALSPIVYGSSGGTSVGTVIKTAAERDLGLQISVEDELRFDDLLSDLDASQYGLFVLGWIADYPDPENFLVPLFHTGAPANHGNYSSPKVDDLLDRAAVEQDAKKRTDLYRQAQQQILDDVAIIPLYHPTDYTLVKPYVKGLSITAMGILRLETVWIERDTPAASSIFPAAAPTARTTPAPLPPAPTATKKP